MAVTISDIARKVGKSRQLVSAVLSGGRSSSVASEATRERILRVARRLGYLPNAAARAVSTGRFNAVGVLLSTAWWKSSLPEGMLEGIRQALTERDMHLSLSWFDDERLTKNGQMPKILREMMADGLLIKYDSYVPKRMIDVLGRSQVPAVWMNSKRKSDCVYPDDLGAGERAARHLIDLGHRRIAYAEHNPRPPRDHYSSTHRRKGYEHAMRAAGLAPRLVSPGRAVPLERRVALARKWLSRRDRPTAVVTYGADDAWPVIHAAALSGLEVPGDLSVITFAGGPLVRTGVQVTTVLVPEEAVGRVAVEMLLEKIADPSRRLGPRPLPFGFDEGATSAPPKGSPAASGRGGRR